MITVNTYHQVKELGGGVLNELSHELDLMYFLFGKPKSLVIV